MREVVPEEEASHGVLHALCHLQKVLQDVLPTPANDNTAATAGKATQKKSTWECGVETAVCNEIFTRRCSLCSLNDFQSGTMTSTFLQFYSISDKKTAYLLYAGKKNSRLKRPHRLQRNGHQPSKSPDKTLRATSSTNTRSLHG